jgi:GntR family transcriptional regulator
MRIVPDYRSGEPIYEQIKEQLKEAVLSGELEEGDLLPSIRQLARDLKVSVITTTRAYSDLELEGFIRTAPGKGCYVTKIDEGLVRSRYREELRSALRRVVRRGKAAGLAMDEIHGLLDEAERGER